MALRTTTLALFLALLPLTASAANGFGAAPAGGANQNPFGAGPMSQPFEPWVKTAKVGDFVVIKSKDGKLQRKTVKSIEADVLVVESSIDGGKAVEFKINRDEKSALPSRELELAKSSSGSVKLGTQSVQYEVYDGFVKGLTMAMNGQETFKAMKYQKVVAQGVPFGGIIKLMQAHDDGKPLPFGNGQKTGRIKNANETLELWYEVTEFGVGK